MNTLTNHLSRLLFGIAMFATAASAYAAKDDIYTSLFSSKAASGYDVVAYFTEGMPVEGKGKWSTEYKDAEWLFSSQENLDLFVANPEKYAPQYGGYCAWAVAQGSTASADPLQWTVLNDKLYLNYDASVQAMWQKDRDNLIVLGDKNWPTVLE